MRILHLLSQTELTGSESYALSLCEDQRRRGHELWVASDQFHLPFEGVTKVQLPISQSRFWIRWKNIFALAQLIRSQNIDLIHAHSRAACRHSRWLELIFRIPVLSSIHGYQHSSLSKKIFQIYGTTVIAICEKIQDQLVQDFGLKPEQVKVLRNPIKMAEVKTSGPRTLISIIGRSSGPKGERLRKLFTSEIQSWLKSTSADIHLYLTGMEAKESLRLMQLIRPEDQHRIQISGEYVDLARVYLASQVVIASGRIAIEAAAHGAEVLSLGESTFEGHLRPENYQRHLYNNFGDVGPEYALDPQAVTHDLKKCLRSPLTENERSLLLKKLTQEFEPQFIFEQIDTLARGLRLLYRCPWIPVLMYHRVPEQPLSTSHRTFVTRDNFEKHLLYFSSQGFTTLTFSELSDFWFERKSLDLFPRRPLILTFDDGYLDNITNAAPLLKQYGFRANLFVLSDPSISSNSWDQEPQVGPSPLVNGAARKQIDPSVFEICSHGESHTHLTECSQDELKIQIFDSKSKLEAEFGRSVVAFAPPYGSTNEQIGQLAKQAGYHFSVNTDRGALRWTDDPYQIFRVNMFPEESWLSLWKKTQTWYRKYYAIKRKT